MYYFFTALDNRITNKIINPYPPVETGTNVPPAASAFQQIITATSQLQYPKPKTFDPDKEKSI